MSKKMDCNIIRDLFPSYIDGICSPESKACIQEHVNECMECREMLVAMQDAFPEEETNDNITTEEEQIIKRVNEKLKRDILKRTWGYRIAAIVVVLCLAILILPLKTISEDDLQIQYTTYEVAQYISKDTTGVKNKKENEVYFMDDDVNIDTAKFYEFKIPGYMEYQIFLEEEWAKKHDYVSFVTLKSKYPIKKYSYTVNDENGENVFKLTKINTTLVSRTSEGNYEVVILVPERIDSCGDRVDQSDS